ncbi:glycosyl hydrolase [Cohnella thailandensis]|uniref:Glycosyl hydrolases family 2 sugar binding domain-containing protein n=1 Tax=Cohnella thailandensis TaxID=557557 RepID=A0A841STC8_9BACL|nr:glycosyl hydrolase [Cohnella thailandensis]MBB6633846.1 hypothetical protein [Cohnella thailandensis]MBP1972529.1 hypothetical protein [Cohnella thailandensis]
MEGTKKLSRQEDSLRKLFKEPRMEDRPAAFWVWNDDMSPEQIRKQLRELADKGFGGAFLHARPGLQLEYLSEEWFERWGIALETAEELGLKLSIYDENSYPSGFAGGHVPAELPDCLANCVHFRIYGHEELAKLKVNSSLMLNKPGHPIRAFAMRSSRDGQAWEIDRDVTLLPAEEWGDYGDSCWLFELGTPETNPWLGGFAYTDLLRPEVTEHFLRSTHERYRERFGERFGSVIPAMFTDEPEISPGNLFHDGDSFLPFTYWFAAEFENRNGYSLLDYLPYLFRDVDRAAGAEKDAGQVRYDYYSTIHELWTNNSVRPISEWCERNGLAYTGHYVEHNWPHPFNRSSPSVMSMYEYMHWPAIDHLKSETLRPDRRTEDNSSHHLICVKEAHSAANQFDRPRVLCEAFGAGGWESSFEDYRRIGDWLYAHGVNFLTPHFTMSSIAGARKRDHPQSFDWRQPWWNDWRTLADYFARLTFALSQGKTRNRILVLNPTTSSYLFAPRDLRENAVYKDGVEATRKLAQRLSDCGWDYDLGDEYIIERHGYAAEGRFGVARREYDIVIVPPAMIHLRPATAELLHRYMESGGKVYSLSQGLERLGGAAWQPDSLTKHARWSQLTGYEDLNAALLESMSPRIRWESAIREQSRIASLRRELEDGSVLFFVANGRPEPFEDTLIVNGGGAEIWEPFTGEIGSVAVKETGSGELSIPVKLPGSGSLLIRVLNGRPEEAEEEAPTLSVDLTPTVPFRELAGSRTEVSPKHGNILPILYLDLEIGAKRYSGISALQANQLIYERHGLPVNPWDNGIQFKRRLLYLEDSMDERTGMAASYRFAVRQGEVPSEIGLIVERPELYRIQINGHELSVQEGTCWLDSHMGQTDISAFIREGENVIRLVGKPFSIRMEIEAVYVTGSFSVEESNGEWVIGEPKPIGTGSWREQGYPFYGGAVAYRKQVLIPEGKEPVRVTLPDWRGTIATVFVNGTVVGRIGLDRCPSLDITSRVTRGEKQEIAVRVAGSFRNLLGPHFDPSRPRNIAWPSFWKRTPAFGPPPAKQFDLLDYGLLEDFRVEIGL